MKNKIQTEGKLINPHFASDWSEAFDRCREAGRPLWFQVGREVGKCFPSGRFETAIKQTAETVRTAS
jgi:hypothetical protein